MGAVADPGAARRDPLALHHRSGMSNHRYEITLATGLHLQNGEPVLGVMVGDALDGTRSSAACFGMALKSAFMSGTSTMLVSSMTRRSHSNEFSSFRVNPPCFGLISKSRCLASLGSATGCHTDTLRRHYAQECVEAAGLANTRTTRDDRHL